MYETKGLPSPLFCLMALKRSLRQTFRFGLRLPRPSPEPGPPRREYDDAGREKASYLLAKPKFETLQLKTHCHRATAKLSRLHIMHYGLPRREGGPLEPCCLECGTSLTRSLSVAAPVRVRQLPARVFSLGNEFMRFNER